MVSIRYSLILIALLLLQTGCGGLPTAGSSSSASNSSDSNAEVIGSDDGTAPDGSEPVARIKQPNPYLENAPRISAQERASFERGIAAMEAEDWTEAELVFQEMTLTSPKLSGPWVNLGIIYETKGDQNAAEHAFSKAIDVNPLNTDAYNNLAILKREQGNFEAAESFFLNSLAKWPDNPEAHCNLGILYDLYMGKWAPALEEYKTCEALSDEPNRQLRGWIIDLERRIAAQ